MLREDDGRSRRPQELKAKLAVKTLLTSCKGMLRWPAVVDSQRSAWHEHTPGQRPPDIVWGLSVGDWQKSKTKKASRAPRCIYAGVFDLGRLSTGGTFVKAHGQAAGQRQTRRYGIMGTRKNPAPAGSTEYSKLISPVYRTEGY